MRSLYYIVDEKNAQGVLRSQFFTPNPWQALAEWLLKVHKPVGLPPGMTEDLDRFEVITEGKTAPVGNILLNMSAILLWEGREIRNVNIATDVSFRPRIQARSPGSAPFYMKDTYMSAVTHMRNRIKRYSRGELDVAYVLTHCAGRNVQHNFWRSDLVQRNAGALGQVGY